jgi:hypothetical protein
VPIGHDGDGERIGFSDFSMRATKRQASTLPDRRDLYAVQRDERRANHVAFDLKTELGTLADGFQQERLFRTSELA